MCFTMTLPHQAGEEGWREGQAIRGNERMIKTCRTAWIVDLFFFLSTWISWACLLRFSLDKTLCQEFIEAKLGPAYELDAYTRHKKAATNSQATHKTDEYTWGENTLACKKKKALF